MLLITNNKVYDVLKQLAQITLPALGTLYFALSQIWGLSHGTEVIGTITAIDAFLGVILQLSSATYKNTGARYDGTVNIVETEDKKLFTLDIEGDPNDLDQKSEIILKINTEDS